MHREKFFLSLIGRWDNWYLLTLQKSCLGETKLLSRGCQTVKKSSHPLLLQTIILLQKNGYLKWFLSSQIVRQNSKRDGESKQVKKSFFFEIVVKKCWKKQRSREQLLRQFLNFVFMLSKTFFFRAQMSRDRSISCVIRTSSLLYVGCFMNAHHTDCT